MIHNMYRLILDEGLMVETLGAIMVVIVSLLDLQLPMQSVAITTNIVSSNAAQHEVYSI